jgi:hypothetical protein
MRRRVSPRPASGGARGKDAPPLFKCPETFQPLQKAFPAVLVDFWGLFCIFEIVFDLL